APRSDSPASRRRNALHRFERRLGRLLPNDPNDQRHADRRAGLARGPGADRVPDQRALPRRRPPLDAHGRDPRGAPAPVPRGELAAGRRAAGGLDASDRGPRSPAPGSQARPYLPARARAGRGFAGFRPERIPGGAPGEMTPSGTLLFTRSDVAALLDLSECI